jgi:hypothetical protein
MLKYKLKLGSHLEDIKEMYLNNCTVASIARKHNCYEQSVINALKYLKIYNPKLPNTTKNPDYFKNINTYNKAYILGFIIADGAIVRNSLGYPSLTITIHRRDISILELIKKELGVTNKIIPINRPSSFDKTKITDHVRLVICNQTIVNDLLLLGVKERKSLTMENIISIVPELYKPAFIIGYFDGDGSVSLAKDSNTIIVNIRGTECFLKGISDFLMLEVFSIKQYDSIPRLAFASKEEILKFFNLYKYTDFFLKRKYNKFKERIS